MGNHSATANRHTTARYAPHVGRVGALAVALGIGAAITTGHGMGLGVAYADENPDTTQNDTDTDNNGDPGTPPPTAAADVAAEGGSAKPRSPLSRIADIPKMIFNATGGAQTSSAVKTRPQLPKQLRTVIDDVADAVKDAVPDTSAQLQGTAPQGNSNAGSRGFMPVAKAPASANPRAIASIPAKVADQFRSSLTPPAGPSQRSQTPLAHVLGPRNADITEGLSFAGQQHVAQAAVTGGEDQGPLGALAVLPGRHVSVLNTVLAVAVAPFLTPNPAAPQDPPLLLGVLAWARREVQRTFCNTTPVAVDDRVDTVEDVDPIKGNVLTNDVDPDLHDVKTVTNPGTYEGNNGTLVLAADGSYVYTPKPDANGQDVFTYSVSDETSPWHLHGLSSFLPGDDHTDTGTLTINLAAVNDAPVVANPITDQTATEDSSFNYTIPVGAFTDVDGDTLSYTATGLPAGLTFNPGTRTISGTPTTPGTYTVTVTAADAGTVPASDAFNLKVVNTNDAPTLTTPIPDQTINEDAAYNYAIPTGTFTDIDPGDILTYTATGLPTGLTLNPTTGIISGTPTTPGTYTVLVTATDISDTAANDEFALTVANTNDAPTLVNEIPDQTTNEDAPYSYTIPGNTFTDIDGDDLTYAASGLPAGLTINPNSGVISGTPTTPGIYTVAVSATDTSNTSATDTFTLTVANTNDAPTLANPIPNQNATEDTAFSYTIPTGTFTDVDPGDTLTYTATGLPAGLSLNPTTGVISGTPTTPGTNTVSVTATDLSGASATDTFTFTVANTPDEAAPLLNVGNSPTHMAVVGNLLYVTNFNDDTVTVVNIDTNTMIDTNPNIDGTQPISVGDSPYQLRVVGNKLYVSNYYAGSVTVIDLNNNSVIKTIDTGSNANNLAVFGNKLFVSNEFDDTVWVIDTNTDTVIDTNANVDGVQPISVGQDGPFASLVSGNVLIVANYYAGTVTQIRAASNELHDIYPAPGVQSTITGVNLSGPRGVATAVVDNQLLLYVSNDNGTVTVINFAENYSEVDTNPNLSGTQPISVGSGGILVDIVRSGDRLYVADYDADRIDVIDVTSNTVIETIPVGDGPWGLVIDDGRLFVGNRLSDTVSVVDITSPDDM